MLISYLMNIVGGGDDYAPEVIHVADDRINGPPREVCEFDPKENPSPIILEGLLASIALGMLAG